MRKKQISSILLSMLLIMFLIIGLGSTVVKAKALTEEHYLWNLQVVKSYLKKMPMKS